VENGFKDTDIGAIPEDWNIDTLGNAFDIQQGKSVSPKSRKGISPYPFLRTSNVFWGRIDLTKLDRMDFTDAEIERLALKADDLLVCEGGDIGRTAIWESQIPLCLYQNHLHRLRTNRRDISPRFFMYWMQAALTLLGLYEGFANKTTIPNLSRSRLGAFVVPIPSKADQDAIVFALQKLQQAIGQQEKIIIKTKELKRSLMHRLFTYGLRGEKLKKTKIGLMPENWKLVSIGDAYEFTTKPRGLNLSKHKEFPFIPMELISENQRLLHKYEMRNSFSSGTYVQKGDLVVAKITPSFENGKQGIVSDIPLAFCYATTEVWPLHGNHDQSNIDYLYYYLKKPDVRNEIAGKMEGSTGRQRVSKSVLSETKIPLPSYDEQVEINNIFISLDQKIGMNESKKRSLQDIFKSMLQLLMTGQVRVKDINFTN